MRQADIDSAAPLFGAGLGLDSIDALELVLGIEQTFGVKIEDEAAGLKAFKSVEALAAFIAEQQRFLTEDATQQYTAVVNMHVPNWEVAAYARLGDMFFQFAQYIRTAPPPPDIARNNDLLDAYNVIRDEQTQRFVNIATTGFQRCIRTSTTVHWFNEWTQLCERELNNIDRARFPVADEVRVEPNLLFSRAANSRPVYSLQTAAEAAEDEGSQGGAAANATAGNN